MAKRSFSTVKYYLVSLPLCVREAYAMGLSFDILLFKDKGFTKIGVL